MNVQQNNTQLTRIMIWVFVFVTVVWYSSFLVIANVFGHPRNAGDTGDLFGAVGALFSGWAFVGVLWAILLQRKSLEIQHHDLMASLEEMKQARRAHEESAETLSKQVKAMKSQTRADVLRTLLEIPLRVDSTSFLASKSQDVNPLRDGFGENLRELMTLNEELKKQKDL